MHLPRELQWNSTRPVPVDFAGPTDVDFDPFDAEQPGIARFEAMAERYGDKVAIDDGTCQLTYRQVRRSVHALMAKIAALPRGRPVVALLHNTATFPIVFLAHLGTGRALVPVDASDPPERQSAILRETAPAAILLGEGVTMGEGLCDRDVPRIRMDPDPAEPAAMPVFAVHLQDAAGVAYTSGSTGRPKGLAFSQRQFLTATAEYVDACHINAEDRILCLASLSGAGCRDALVALYTGATLRIVNIRSNGVGAVIRALDADRVTILSFVPSVLRVLVRLDGAARAFQHLRILDLFGDRTSAADLAMFQEVLPPDCKIRLSLASTEAAHMFHWFVRPEALGEGQPVPCGYLARGVSMALLNEAGGPADDGEAGELVVRGPTLAMGAWQEGRLLPGPFLTDPENPGSRIFHTGDVIRLRSDGLAEFVGRRDRRIKIRGLRADLGDLEDALRMYPGIADVAVMVRSLEDEASLVAYVAAENPGDPPDLRALRRSLVTALPAYMMPAEIRFLPAIPRLPNFKPDFMTLERLDRDRSGEASLVAGNG
ncbi:MAG: AMP-binding protein [Rhodopila sp.]|nr:AMP-binding protein [Rhodopila sp.]